MSAAGRLAAVAAMAACALAVVGCQPLTVQGDWDERAVLPALPMAYLETAPARLAAECGEQHPGAVLYGCAKRDYAMRLCTIVTGPSPAAWLLDHERKHCAGFDHGPARA